MCFVCGMFVDLFVSVPFLVTFCGYKLVFVTIVVLLLLSYLGLLRIYIDDDMYRRKNIQKVTFDWGK